MLIWDVCIWNCGGYEYDDFLSLWFVVVDFINIQQNMQYSEMWEELLWLCNILKCWNYVDIKFALQFMSCSIYIVWYVACKIYK